ncbi:MAG TPA: class I SAM-dependent methyltransferase [Thermoanaerobaculia bacterium]|nr:class I SAM-dependent methyltransferase [Thermoanaerobaculia bacterium]
MTELPMPPPELRYLVGPLEESFFDNPSGAPVFPEIPLAAYDSVFDFGCGVGRLARQMIQQTPRPRRYVGVDLNPKLIAWCRENLAPAAPGFEFHHQDVYNPGFNPEGRAQQVAFPAADRSASLMIAWSVFTHVVEAQAVFYLREAGRVLAPEGILLSTWFFFDKDDFPMMQEFQNALFINDVDPSNAVIFDKEWLRKTAAEAGLAFTRIVPPTIRGYQWQVWMTPTRPGLPELDFPPDLAPVARKPPPLGPQA